MRRLVTDSKDTICALATAHGAGAISVVRVSGPQAVDILSKVAPFLPKQLESHKIYYGMLKAVNGGASLDEVLVAYFQNGRSFTGETVFEISCHGSEVIVAEILRNLVEAGARPAERGEFTYRAFMNGRLDLVQAESVLALIESGSKRATSLALRQLQGGLSVQIKGLLDRMTKVLAHLEANIDFAAEDIEIESAKELAAQLGAILIDAKAMVAGYRQGRIIKDGYHVALIGRPNAGKSSLLNALAGEDRAIVTPVAGTTRDFVEAQVSEDGLKLTYIDTAGLRLSDDVVEKIGIERSLEKLKDVELVLLIADSTANFADDGFLAQIPWEKTAVVVNKSDLKKGITAGDLGIPRGVFEVAVSATTGEGLEELRGFVRSKLKQEVSEDSTVVSNARHFRGLQQLCTSLETAMPLLLGGESPDLIALELQTGLAAVYEILGLTYDDQVMDKVFQEFCLGK